jgi:hypothetical protein
MAAMAGLINHNLTAEHSLTTGQSLTAGNSLTGTQASSWKGANPMTAQTSGTSSTGSSGNSSATISANDFLTLLVTEMQNQDPTATTDPNEYINQLVQVNSLEQLIDINQNLSTVLGTSGSSSSGAVGSSQVGAGVPGLAGTSPLSATALGTAAAHKPGTMPARSDPPKTGTPGSNVAAAINQFAQSQSAGQKRAPGNLTIPAAQPAAHHVAHALDGHSHTTKVPGKLPVSR